VLVGREHERSELAAMVAHARDGRGSLALIGGEAGIGKTALARAVLQDSDLTVFEGAAPQAGAPAYWPLALVLRAHARSGGTGRSRGGDGPLAALLRTDPPSDEPSDPPSDAPGLDQRAFLEGVVSAFLAIAAERPAAVFLDDLQWGDEGTIDLIAAIAPALEAEQLLVVGAYRSDEMPRGHPLRRSRTELRRQGRLRELVLEPLGERETAALLARSQRAWVDRQSGS
jgi:predicted ATPase